MATNRESIKKLTNGMWNVPNILTMLRFALIPVFVYYHAHGKIMTSLAVFIIASITDALDGYIARSQNLITDFGKLMDPLADKLMVCAAIICRISAGAIPLWIIIAVGIKELALVIGGVVMLKRGVVVYSRMTGKCATVVFIAGLILSFFHDYFVTWTFPLDLSMLHLAVLLAYLALADYTLFTLRQLKSSES